MIHTPYDGLVFDLDGTLVNSAPDLLAATNHILSSLNRPAVDLSVIRSGISFGALKMLEDGLAATGGVEGHNIAALKKVFLDYYNRNIAVESHIFEGGKALLTQCKTQGLPVAVCTNKSYGLAKNLLDTLEITPLITTLTGGDSFPFKKPDARHLEETRALMGLSNDHTLLMIGDSRTDTKAAQNAGWDCALVSYGYSDVPLDTLGATYIIDQLNELYPLIGLSPENGG